MKARCEVPEERLAWFVAGELDGPEEFQMALHLADCGGCRERAASYGLLREALGGLDASDVIRWHRFPTRFGGMFAASTDRGVSRISWKVATPEAFERLIASRLPGVPVVEDRVALSDAARQITEYLAGDRRRFDLAVDLALTSSPFQRRVLEAATSIPFGEVVSYGQLAERVGSPRASRAVGTALGGNPVAIIVPCHRIVRGDGSVGGYIGGSEMKAQLLELEQRGA